jgi:CPA2 family monovalent cation:H+ antiporter-2
VELTIEPFKGLLMGLFFMSVGMGIDLREVAREPLAIAGAVAGLMLLKALVVAGLFRLAGLRTGASVQGGLLLGQGGEFAFIVIGTALASKLLPAATAQFALLVVSLSLLATPPVAWIGRLLARRLDAGTRDEEPTLPEVAGHVVVIGFGRVGHLLGQVFERQGVPYVGVDRNIARVGRLRSEGLPVWFGNASRPELLHKLQLERAASLVVTMDEPAAAQRVVRNARQHYPGLRIFARSHDEQHAAELLAAGSTTVVPEVLEVGLQLTSLALESVGRGEDEADRIVESERDARMAA